MNGAAASREKGGLSLWAFRFLLWYICILLVQPQNRFTILWPFRIANISFIIAGGLHILSCIQWNRPFIRMGIATRLALALLFFATVANYTGIYHSSDTWNAWMDIIVKNALLLVMIEAMCITVERVWAVQMTAMISTLWWVKGGFRLAQADATYSEDRLMSVAVSLIDNPNSFAYMMCIFLPLYLYAYKQMKNRWVKVFFLLCALTSIFLILKTGSRTGLIILLVLILFLLPHYGRKHWKAVILAGLAMVLCVPFIGERNIRRFKTIPQSMAIFFGLAEPKTGELNQDDHSADERIRKNQAAWQLIKDHPLFGVGLRPDMTPLIQKYPMIRGQVHNEVLMAGQQMGLIGMGLYLGLIAVILFGGHWIRRYAAAWPAVGELGWTFEIQALAILVGGFFAPYPWHPPMMLLAGSASALKTVLKTSYHS